MAAIKPPVNIDPIDPGTGKFNYVWTRWFLDIFAQLGGVDAGTNISSSSFTSDGVLTRITDPDTGTVTFVSRLPTGTANQIAITNADGVEGDPTWSLVDNVILTGGIKAIGSVSIQGTDGYTTSISPSTTAGVDIALLTPDTPGTLATRENLNAALAALDLTAKNYAPWGCFSRLSSYSTVGSSLRGTSIAIGTGLYVADMWRASETSAAVITRVFATETATPLPSDSPFANINQEEESLQLSITTADTSISSADNAYLKTFLPRESVRYLASSGMTISFWIKAPVAGTYCLTLAQNTVNNFVTEYVINSSDTWEFKTISYSAADVQAAYNDPGGDNYGSNGRCLQIIFVLAAGTNFNTGLVGQNDITGLTDNMATSSQVNGLGVIGDINLYDFAINAGTSYVPHSLPTKEDVERAIGPFVESGTDWNVAPSYSSGGTSGYNIAVAAHTSGTAGMTAYVPYKYRKVENTTATVSVYQKAGGGTAGNATWTNEDGSTTRATTATCQGSGGYTKSFVEGFTLTQTAATNIEELVEFHYLANYYPTDF